MENFVCYLHRRLKSHIAATTNYQPNHRSTVGNSFLYPANVIAYLPERILTGADIRHQLPLTPDSRFGLWFFSIEDWVNHLRSWRPTVGVAYSAEDLRQLSQALHLTPIAPPPSIAEAPEEHAVEPLLNYFTALHQRLASLEERVQQLEMR